MTRALKRGAGAGASVLAAAALLLAACGGEVAAPEARTAGMSASASAAAAAADPEALVARLYLLYLGRPAEPAGLAYHAQAFAAAGLPDEPGALLERYRSDALARQLLDGIAASPEANVVAPSDEAALAAVYRTLFNRTPDPGGAAFWGRLLANGTLERAELPLALLEGAHPSDLALVTRKLAVARAFTAALDTPQRQAAYQGHGANAVLRDVLDTIGAGTDAVADAALVEVALARLATVPVFSQVEAIVRTRCLACHSVTPTMPGFSSAPRGIRFDTPEQIRAEALRIHVNVVQTEFMPYGNQTRMTAAERALVHAWFESGTP